MGNGLKKSNNILYIIIFFAVIWFYIMGNRTNEDKPILKENISKDVIKIGDRRYIKDEWNTAQLYIYPCGKMYTDDKGNVLGKLDILDGGTVVKIVDIYYNTGNGCIEDGEEWFEVEADGARGYLHPRHIGGKAY